MDYLARIAIEKSRLTLLVMIGLLLLGFLSYTEIPKRENPTITVRTSVVTAYHPGMDTEQMEELVAIPIERSMRELGEVEEIDTVVMSGAAIFKVVLRDSVPASRKASRNKSLCPKRRLRQRSWTRIGKRKGERARDTTTRSLLRHGPNHAYKFLLSLVGCVKDSNLRPAD